MPLQGEIVGGRKAGRTATHHGYPVASGWLGVGGIDNSIMLKVIIGGKSFQAIDSQWLIHHIAAATLFTKTRTDPTNNQR
jgi:hypothetical protein